ncbi:MAG: ASKHA domain-containing protein [Synergistaceae bacterium]|nr:ASKHA domain-containing protein [Synergistaceae bacterium]
MADDSRAIRFDFSANSLTPRPGETISDVLARGGVPMDHPCGGRGKCGKCLVLVSPAAEPTEAERAAIGTEELAAGWRLSCAAPALPGMIVSFRDNRQKDGHILAAGEARNGGGLRPAADGKYRLAADIGTTTVVVYLLHPKDGHIVATASAGNSQVKFGADVISRIFSADTDRRNRELLQDEIIGTLNGLIRGITEKSGVNTADIGAMYAAGNTTMEHLLLGEDPGPIGRSPFKPTFLRAADRTAASLKLDLPAEATVSLTPNISAFVGGDITAGLYHTDIVNNDGASLFIDIGTNSEMVVCRGGSLYACSAAAGPALEGAQVSTGVRAMEGAVEKVWADSNGLHLAAIEDSPPIGLCGSGIIDMIAVLLNNGVILPAGRFAASENVENADLARRLRKGKRNFSEFVYCFAGEYGAASDLVLTQKDVREVQLAKSAIAVGIKKLTEQAGITTAELDRIYLGGAFGNYIDRSNAMRMGILPRVPLERVLPVGNCAGLGVCRSAFDPEADRAFSYIEANCQSINLAAADDFQQKFVHYLNFDA